MSANSSASRRGSILSRVYYDLPSDHPLLVAARTYVLSISLSLSPALLPILTSRTDSTKLSRFYSLLKNEFGPRGFAFAMAIALGGGAFFDRLWHWIDSDNSSLLSDGPHIRRLKNWSKRLNVRPALKTFLTSLVPSLGAILILHSRGRSLEMARANIPFTIPISHSRRTPAGRISVTLDLSLLLLVRALDAVLQGEFARRAESNSNATIVETSKKHTIHDIRARAARMTDKVDAILFWVASSRIMWCFFYEPERLPRSYVKWIRTLANIDQRILDVLRRRRNGTWTYGETPSSDTLLAGLAIDLGYPPQWGDASILPAHGGSPADEAWKRIGVQSRQGVGGLPCELVHGNVGPPIGRIGASCTSNLVARGSMGFFEALAIYGPVHFLPIILTKPKSLLSHGTLKTMVVSVLRSSLFLSTFINSIWTAVCFTRSLVIARLLPNISHNFYDGPFGGILAGCLTCGGSIWIEQGKRRGEMALYVLPRALRASISDTWLRSGSRSIKVLERLIFAFSLAALVTASRHRPECLRGLSRWTFMFVLIGPKADFFKWRNVSQ